jgi:hypothetical protein
LQEGSQDVVHQRLERCRGVREAERHDEELKQSLVRRTDARVQPSARGRSDRAEPRWPLCPTAAVYDDCVVVVEEGHGAQRRARCTAATGPP